MSPQACIKFATAAFAAITLLCYCKCTTMWQNEMILDPNGDFQIFWDLSAENVTIEVQVRTKGYVGFGFSPAGGMKGADIVTAWVVNSQVILQDRFSADYVEPTIDDNQDYELISGFENDTHTIVRFTRLLETCDKQDLPIVNETMHIIFAWGTDDPVPEEKVEYHGGKNRGSKSINLIAPNADIFPTADGMHTWDMPIPEITASGEKTIYACHIVKIPPTTKKMHMISLQLSQPAIEIQVHHVVMFNCFDKYSSIYEKELNVADRYCTRQFSCLNPVTSLVATDHFEISPKFGIPFGEPDRPTYYFFNIHYNNPNSCNGSVNHANIQVMTTENLRKYEIHGILINGDFDIIIPPQQPNFTYTTICPSECTAKELPVDGINVVSIAFHAHLSATKIHLRHFRDGMELPLIGYTNNFDFKFQSRINLPKEVKVMPGDIIAAQCEFNTMDRTNFTMGGFGTRDEMCAVGLLYYPKSNLSTIIKLGPYEDILQILESASSKRTKNKSSLLPKLLPYRFVRNFNASFLTKQDIYDLSYIQTYGKMNGWCINSASRYMHFTVDYPKNITSISYEEGICENSRLKT